MSLVELNRFDPEDLDFVYTVLYDPETRPLWASSEEIISFEEFKKVFKQKYNNYYHSFRVVRTDSVPSGIVYSSNLSEDGHSVCLTVLMIPDSPVGTGAQAAYQHISYLYDRYPLDTIIIEVKAENTRCIECLDERFFEACEYTETVINGETSTEYRLFRIDRHDFERISRIMGD